VGKQKRLPTIIPTKKYWEGKKHYCIKDWYGALGLKMWERENISQPTPDTALFN